MSKGTQSVLRGAGKAGCLFKPCGAVCVPSGHHPSGCPCLFTCLRFIVSTDGQSAFDDDPVACEQTGAVTPTQNESDHPTHD